MYKITNFITSNYIFILFYFALRKPPVMDRPALNEEKPSVLAERRNIFDNDEFDLFSRSDVNMENIHIGKK